MARLLTDEEIAKKVLDSIEIMVSSDTNLTLMDCIKKELPIRPDYESDGYADGCLVYDTWICPRCGERYEVDYDNYKYCPECGQHIDLSEVVTDGSAAD